MDLVSLVEALVVAGLTDEGIWIELDLNGTGVLSKRRGRS
jgi:hypothetical protein